MYVEGGFVYRNTKDYIQRNITDLSGGKSAATYVNYGKVLTKGYNISARYGFGRWLSVGGNFTQMNVCDNMKTSISGSAENIAYKERMPNLPYIFADSDVTFYWRDLWKKGQCADRILRQPVLAQLYLLFFQNRFEQGRLRGSEPVLPQPEPFLQSP